MTAEGAANQLPSTVLPMDVEQAIRERRTHKAFQPEPVPRELLDELLELARWAPNHHLTNPWRFRVVGPASLERLKQAAGPEAAAKLDRAPTLVAATVTSTGDPVQDEEDLCATACATYLVLLGAHARGLAGYWRTPGVLRTPGGARCARYPGRRAVRRSDPPGMAPAGEGGARARAPQLDRHLPRLMASLVFKERPAVGQPTGLLVLSHGRGTSELDLLPLADVLDPQRRLHVAAPRGPLQFSGVPGYHWYAVPRVGHPDPATFEASRSALAAFHDELWEQTGLGPDQTVLGGFSMGTVMSYALGLSDDRPAPAGILALSGFVPTVEGWEPSLSDRQDTRVFISHGRNDPVISVEFARRAHELLERGGLEVEYHESEAAHQIDPVSLRNAVRWISGVLPPPDPS